MLISPVIAYQHLYQLIWCLLYLSLSLSASVIRLAIWNEHWWIVCYCVNTECLSSWLKQTNLIANVIDTELYKQKLWAIINHYWCTTVKHQQWKPCLECDISKGVTATQTHKPCCILLLNLMVNFSRCQKATLCTDWWKVTPRKVQCYYDLNEVWPPWRKKIYC